MRGFLSLALATLVVLASLVAVTGRAQLTADAFKVTKKTEATSHKDRLRYAGKSFAEWRDFFLTEIEPKTRMSCLKPLETFSMHGYGAEVTSVFLEMMAEYDDAFTIELSGYDGETWDRKFFKTDDSDDTSVNVEFRKIIHRLGPIAVPVLQKALTGKSSAARWVAIEELAEIGSFASAAIPDLIDLTRHESLPVRFGSLVALGKIAEGDRRALKPLLRGLRDKEPKVRLAALTAIEELGPDFAKPAAAAIVKLLDDDEPTVRFKALEAVVKADAAVNAVPAVVRLLQERNASEETKKHAYALLQEAGSQAKPAVAILLATLKNLTDDGKRKEPEPKNEPRPLLTRLPGDEASETSNDEVAKIVQTLAAIGPDAKDAVPLLTRILRSNPWRGEAIRSALKKIEPKS